MDPSNASLSGVTLLWRSTSRGVCLTSSSRSSALLCFSLTQSGRQRSSVTKNCRHCLRCCVHGAICQRYTCLSAKPTRLITQYTPRQRRLNRKDDRGAHAPWRHVRRRRDSCAASRVCDDSHCRRVLIASWFKVWVIIQLRYLFINALIGSLSDYLFPAPLCCCVSTRVCGCCQLCSLQADVIFQGHTRL